MKEYIFITLAFIIGALSVGFTIKQTEPILKETSTLKENTFVYFEGEALPDCAENDKRVCNFSCAPDGRCIFIPNKN